MANPTVPNNIIVANVAYKHPKYNEMYLTWELIRDAVVGERAIRIKGETYLPHPGSENEDDKQAHKARYIQWQTQAIWYPATGRTLEGLVGEVFSKDPVSNLPPRLKLLEGNIDGNGMSLTQLSKNVLSTILSTGRGGLLVDYPKRVGEGGEVQVTTVEDLNRANVRPRILLYDERSIINWRVRENGALAQLSMVVLEEPNLEADDGFEQKELKQYRVLRLTEQGCTVQVWKQKDGIDALEEGPIDIITDSAGKPFDTIPFHFFGPKYNNPEVQDPPLEGLARLNVGHYRNSAAYEDSVAMVGQPTLVVTGITKDWVKEVLKGKLRVGARAFLPLPTDADAKFIQAEPNTLAMEAMKHKENQMAALGAKLVEQSTTQRTATEAGFDEASKNSILGACTANGSEVVQNALKTATRFTGEVSSKLEFYLNSDFDLAQLDPAMMAQLLALYQGDAITWEELRAALRANGTATEEDKKALQMIQDDPLKEMLAEVPGLPGATKKPAAAPAK